MPDPTLRKLDIEAVLETLDKGGAIVDLRSTDEYLDAHIPASLGLLYEAGPGMASRARDCIPLEMALVLLEAPGLDLAGAAAALRGKGFHVEGTFPDGINAWANQRGRIASTERVTARPPEGATLLDVGDPGAPQVEGSVHIPVERLSNRVSEIDRSQPVVVAAGYGVRAAVAVGILERGGLERIGFWRTRN